MRAALLKLLSLFPIKTNLKSKGKNKPFIICITIDTEPGFLSKNGMNWFYKAPDAFQGYYYGIKNLLELFNKHKTKSTFLLSPHCFSAKKEEYKKIMAQLKNIKNKNHEIGLHLHPNCDSALQKSLSKKFTKSSALYFGYKTIKSMLIASKKLLKKHLNINPISFRWGNWGLGLKAVKALQEAGFKIDTSACPLMSGHKNDPYQYDWANLSSHYPFFFKNSKILEFPIATFSILNIKFRADPVLGSILTKSFSHYYKNADRSEKPFIFVISTHSSEATDKDGGKTKIISTMEKLIKQAKKRSDVNFLTLKEVYNLYL